MIAHDGLHERRGSLEKLESMVGFWAILEVGERLDEGVLHEMGIQCAARRYMWGSYVCDEYITRGFESAVSSASARENAARPGPLQRRPQPQTRHSHVAAHSSANCPERARTCRVSQARVPTFSIHVCVRSVHFSMSPRPLCIMAHNTTILAGSSHQALDHIREHAGDLVRR